MAKRGQRAVLRAKSQILIHETPMVVHVTIRKRGSDLKGQDQTHQKLLCREWHKKELVVLKTEVK